MTEHPEIEKNSIKVHRIYFIFFFIFLEKETTNRSRTISRGGK